MKGLPPTDSPPGLSLKLSTPVDLERTQLVPDPLIWKSLTEREKEVFALVSDGLPDKAIAQQLGLSARTIIVHVQRIIEKVEAIREIPHHTRGSLVATVCRTRAPLLGFAALSQRISTNSVVSGPIIHRTPIRQHDGMPCSTPSSPKNRGNRA